MELYSHNGSIDNFSLDSIRRAVFHAAQRGDEKDIEYILERPDKYPFLINSKDEQGHTLFHFYNHNPEAQQLLFERGLNPEPEKNAELQNILQDRQSVHAGQVVKKTNFIY